MKTDRESRGMDDGAEKLIEKAAPEKSDRQLAKALGVSQPTVSATRKDLEEKSELIKVITSTGADGKERPRQVLPG